MTKHRILLISTGGTIAGEVAKNKKADADRVVKAKTFTDIIGPTLSYIEQERGIEIDVTPEELCEVDSSDIKPTHWEQLADLIYERFDDFDSFVITHGTNTLGYTCAALSFALHNPGKPIILTGSQVPMEYPGSDALTNLQNAIRVATWTKNDIKGVMAVFGSHIITGTRVKKDTEFDYDAFKSFNTGSIARIGRIINFNEENLSRHIGYLTPADKSPPARTKANLRKDSVFETKLLSFSEFPGMDPDIFLKTILEHNIKGVIFRAFGAGDASTDFQDAFRALKKEQIPVVITTQAPNGNANLQVNEPGKYLSDNKLVIPAYDMSIESQLAKLSWLLPKLRTKEISYDRLCELMITNLRGEISVIWEGGYGS